MLGRFLRSDITRFFAFGFAAGAVFVFGSIDHDFARTVVPAAHAAAVQPVTAR